MARMVPLMFAARFPYALVIVLREHCPPELAHACDHDDRRLEKPASGQIVAGVVLQQAEQPELLTPGPGQPDVVPAAHRPVMDGIPLSPPENGGHHVQFRRELCVDSALAAARKEPSTLNGTEEGERAVHRASRSKTAAGCLLSWRLSSGPPAAK